MGLKVMSRCGAERSEGCPVEGEVGKTCNALERNPIGAGCSIHYSSSRNTYAVPEDFHARSKVSHVSSTSVVICHTDSQRY